MILSKAHGPPFPSPAAQQDAPGRNGSPGLEPPLERLESVHLQPLASGSESLAFPLLDRALGLKVGEVIGVETSVTRVQLGRATLTLLGDLPDVGVNREPAGLVHDLSATVIISMSSSLFAFGDPFSIYEHRIQDSQEDTHASGQSDRSAE